MVVEDGEFSSPDADLIVESSDAVRFRVFRRILIESSPFFRSMFALPQPASSEIAKEVDCIPVSEESATIVALLRLVYPIENPVIDSLETLVRVLSAATKYDMVSAIESLRAALVAPRFVEREPVRVYAIACRFGLEAEAKTASKYTLNIALLDFDGPPIDDLSHMSASAYDRLLRFHRTRSRSAQERIPLYLPKQCLGCEFPSRWWTDYRWRACEKLQQRPTSEVICSLPFIISSVRAGCVSCGANMHDNIGLFATLKAEIDALPDTV